MIFARWKRRERIEELARSIAKEIEKVIGA